MDEALIKTYARKGITHKNESLIDPKHPDHYKAMPILGDVYDVLMETEDTKRLAHILNRLVHGSASSFNQQTNVDLTNKYTVLDISELTGSSDLLTVGMFVALDYVWDKAKENRTEEKAIFVDEVWQLIGASSNRLAAEFVLEIAKIIRHTLVPVFLQPRTSTTFLLLMTENMEKALSITVKPKLFLTWKMKRHNV